MAKVLSTLLYRIWLVSATLIVLIAIIISVGRALIPYADQYRPELEQFLTERIGKQVSITAIETEWKSLGPSITLREVDIENTLRVSSISTDIKTMLSLYYRTLITENLVIEGLNLYVDQQPDGTLTIAGQAPSLSTVEDDPFDFALLQDWLQSQTEISITRATIHLSLRNNNSYPINITEMSFKRGNNIYQLQGFTELPGENRIDFVLEANGLLTDTNTTGQLYIDTHDLDLTKIPLDAFWQEAKIMNGSVKLNAWIDWHERRFDKAIATLDIDDFQMSLQGSPQGNINKLSTQLLWQLHEDGWQLQTNDTTVRTNQREWPTPFVQVRMRQGEDYANEYYLRSSLMDVGIWADLLLAKQDLDPEFRNRLLAMDPQGFLDAVRLDAVVSPEELIDFNLSARFSELGFKPYGTTPGISNMAGQIQVLEDSGNLYLDSRLATYNDPNMFRWELPLGYINADIDWSFNDDSLSLVIQHFTSHIHGARLRADGKISIPADTQGVNMELYAELDDGDLRFTPRFLPYGIMQPDLVEYLDDSVIAGRLSDVTVLLRGNSVDFPFLNNSGVFAIYGRVTDTDYKFEPSWPTVKELDAELYFIGNSMKIEVNSAETLRHQLRSATVSIDDFSQQPTLLEVVSNSQGELLDAGAYILDSPLSDAIFPVINNLDMSGPFELDLDLAIPLEGEGEQINGEIRLNDARVVVKAIDLVAESISGSLQIENSSVNSRDLTANVLGGESRITMKQTSSSDGIDTELTAQGNLTLAAVYDTFDDIIPKGLEGATDYEATIRLPAVDDNFSVEIDTRTIGMTSTIPYPMAKTDDIGLPLKLVYQKTSASQAMLQLDWLDKFTLLSAYENDLMTSGIMALGTNEVTLPERPGMAITGIADNVDLVAWLDYLSDLESTPDSQPREYDDFYLEDISIENLNYFFLNFRNTRASAEFGKDKMQFQLTGDDINGIITVPLPFAENTIDISLDSVRIPDQFADEEGFDQEPEVTDELARNADSEPLPAIDFSCKQCFYNNVDLGTATMSMRPLEQGNEVAIKLTGKSYIDLNINASWFREEDKVYTAINGAAKTSSMERLLNTLNQNPGVRDTSMELTGNIRWLGDPSMFNSQSLSGQVLAKGGKGSQKQLSDRKARIFSLLSLGSIARKLTLDFSDLFQDGFFYTSIDGTLNFADGVMTTDDVKVKGTSADVQVKGQIDFTDNSIEQCILVTPDLGSSLPILAGWAIEPVTGFFVFLMSKIFQPAIDVVSSIRYQVEGSFDDPTVTEIGKSRAKATISEDDQNPSITVEQNEKPFSCDDQFR